MDGKRVGTGNNPISLASIEIWTDQEMQYLGQLIAGTLRGNEIILLEGPLGAGKTTLSQGIGTALSIPETILSPTFVLVREYGYPPSMIHVDLYRVDSAEQLQNLGMQDILNRETVRVVEWADKFPGLQKWADYSIKFSILSESIRKVDIYGK